MLWKTTFYKHYIVENQSGFLALKIPYINTPADTEAAMLSADTVTVRFTYKGFPDNIVTAINDSGAKITGFTMNNSEYSISIRHDSCKTGIINLLKMIESESDNYSILVPEISVSDIPK